MIRFKTRTFDRFKGNFQSIFPSMNSPTSQKRFTLQSNIFTPSYEGSTLHLASFNGDLASVKFILSTSPHFDSYGRTPLHLASFCEVNSLDIVLELIKCGADVNQGDEEGNSALHFFILRNNQPCVMVLLDHGCEVEGRNEMNLSPIDISNQYMMESIGNLLVSYGAGGKVIKRRDEEEEEYDERENEEENNNNN